MHFQLLTAVSFCYQNGLYFLHLQMLANSFSRGLNGFDIRVNEMVCIMWNWLRMFLAVRALLGRGYTDYIALVEFWVLF